MRFFVRRSMGLSCFVLDYSISEKGKDFRRRRGQLINMAFLGYFMIKTILETGQLGYIFSVYGIDAVITILG
jgi:hypothetical protein